MDIEAMKAELRRAQEEAARLRAENTRLRRDIARLCAQAPLPTVTSNADTEQTPLVNAASGVVVTDSSAEAEKIGLFKRLFRGRDDVYAVRWEDMDGRTGYAPASRNRSEREQGIFLPLTDDVLRDHLDGRRTIGVYPLLLDETCWFLAADFDKQHWQQDVAACMTACDALGVPAAVERSRSGNGGHVWIFFQEPVSAAQARKLGSAILTLAMEQRHQIGLDSYDRLFPNQDTLPKGGFGNLIALPLQKAPRQQGHSVFIDHSFEPYPDQWEFLSGVRRMRPEEVDAIAAAATRTGTVIGVRPSFVEQEEDEDPWVLPPSGKRPERSIPGPFPSSVRVTIANLAYVPKEGLPAAMLSRLWRLAAFQNPEFYRAQMMRLSTFGKPRVISCAEDFEHYIGLPRGCLDEARGLLEAHGVSVDVADEHQPGRSISVSFEGELTDPQQKAAQSALAHDTGVLCAPTAFGKTVVAAWLIAERQVSTLVLVHRRQLLDQWRERLSSFLRLPPEAIGQIGGGRKKPNGDIDIALIQSLGRQGTVDDLVAKYGQVIVDECHHLPAFTFERVLKAAKARFVLGLTATPVRKDGHHPIIVMQCGPLRFKVSSKDEAAARPFVQTSIRRPTTFRLPAGADAFSIQDIYGALTASEQRNDLICTDLLDMVRQGRTPLFLTERKEHLEEFSRRLEGQVRHVVVLHGGTGAKERKAAADRLRAIPAEEPCVVLATGRYAGEGFDYARLDTLLLALPISWQGTLRQYVGRIQREHPGKHEVRIYDYVDEAVPVLVRMYEKRRKGYLTMGYQLQVEATEVAASGRPSQLRFPSLLE